MKSLSKLTGLVLLMLICTQAKAVDGVSIASGVGKGDMRTDRISLRWGWHDELWRRGAWQLDAYWDLSVAHWRVGAASNSALDQATNSAVALAIAPAARLTYARFDRAQPYLDVGVGPAVLSTTTLRSGRTHSRSLGGRFQFEDRIVLGIRFGKRLRYETAYQYIHYSNANLASDNDGIDTQLLSFVVHLGKR